ncbi:cysteine desulfurase [Mumia flava]|uniref:cysteine desulfurase n=1 Tax=Mumia flava TaxID=1348852 RepID=A0A0B2AWS7_9ACTN|nr:cysteine desulfurase family protein [Mumia flava]PJJ48181.1 cysteine desulfurase [Mumia flava]
MRYLDAAATTPVRREVLEAMWPYLTGEFGNPSSHHRVGEGPARGLAQARRTVADCLGARAGEITFTSGGTEADNLAVKGIALARPRGRRVVTSAVEHPAVLEACAYLERVHGFEVVRVGVDGDGVVDLDELRAVVDERTALVSVMLANNEIGTVQPVAQVAAIAHEAGALVHTDAVQALGALPVSPAALGVDALSLSGHKAGAPKGSGVLWTRAGVAVEPLVHGGGQERGRRSGTENVAGAVAMAAAMRLLEGEGRLGSDGAVPPWSAGLAAARDAFVRAVLAGTDGARLTGHATERLPGHASFCFPGTAGETVLLTLEQDHQVICSSGSACAAGSSDPSPVLLALGISPEVAETAVRFTAGGPGDFEGVADAVVEAVRQVGSLRN